MVGKVGLPMRGSATFFMRSAFLLCLLAVPAQAADRESQERAAQRACLTGNSAKGVEILTDLYLDTRDPTHIYNQGRCYEMNRQYEDAIGRFREYMVKAKQLGSEEKADVEKHIAACRSYLDGAKQESESIHPITAKVEPPQQVTRPTIRRSATAGATRPGAGLRTAGLVAGAVGIAGLVTGVALNLKVNAMSTDLEQPYNYRPGTDSTRKNYKTVGWISYGVGAAGVAAGALLYYLGWRAGSRATLAPTLGPGLAGVALQGGF